MIPAVCIYNPASRSAPTAALIEKLRSRFAANGYSVEFQATERPQHATELARNAVASSASLVIAFGGGATISGSGFWTGFDENTARDFAMGPPMCWRSS